VKKLILVVLAGLATVALPVMGAEAKPSPDKAAGKHGAKSKRCDKARSVGFVVRGTFASADGASVTVTVERANKHASRWLEDGGVPTFDTTGLTVEFVGVVDGDASGTVDLADALTTDRVHVKGKLALPKRKCEGDAVLTVKKVKVSREAPEAPAEETTTE